MRKKILAAVLLGTMLVAGTGCQGSNGEEKQNASVQEDVNGEESSTEETENNVTEGEQTSQDESGQSEEMEKEQEAGAAQMEADAIDRQHEKKEIPTESVERTAFAKNALELDESANWIRTGSENREDGSFGETYVCEEGLEYEWSYMPSEKADAQSGLEAALSQLGWSVSDTSKNDALSESLGHEVYNYIAYEDDNGYSMIHQGLYLDMEGGYYTADFSMMEGSMGEYYDRAETLLSQIYIAQ